MECILERIERLNAAICSLDDTEYADEAGDLVRDMLFCGAEYVGAVCKSESVRRWFSRGLSVEDHRQVQESWEISRRSAHNSFIGLVEAVNRLCDKLGCERVYTGVESRVGYAEFARKIVEEIFVNRRI